MTGRGRNEHFDPWCEQCGVALGLGRPSLVQAEANVVAHSVITGHPGSVRRAHDGERVLLVPGALALPLWDE